MFTELCIARSFKKINNIKINIMAGINFINEEEYSKPLTFKNNDVIPLTFKNNDVIPLTFKNNDVIHGVMCSTDKSTITLNNTL